MWPLLLVLLLSYQIGTAHVSQDAAFTSRLTKLLQKLEKLNVSMTTERVTSAPPEEKLYLKLDKLNAIKLNTTDYSQVSTTTTTTAKLTEGVETTKETIVDSTYTTVAKVTPTKHIPAEALSKKPSASSALPPVPLPERVLTEEDDEMLSAIQIMGNMSADQVENMATELLRSKTQIKATNTDISDDDWMDEMNDLGEGEYPNDEWDNEYVDGMSPSAITRTEPGDAEMTMDPVLATLIRPRVVYERPSYMSHHLASALAHIKSVIINGKCHTPQPRWISVRQLAPAADTVYMPSQVLLHRCTSETGCCLDQTQQCAPINGEYITLPFYLNKATGNYVARIVFYNHTECGCISNSSRTTQPPSTISPRLTMTVATDDLASRSSDSFEFSADITNPVRRETDSSVELLNGHGEEYHMTSATVPELKRCTCPTLFQAKTEDKECSCTCDWPDHSRRRNCLSLSRGREHFGLRDRVCIGNGDCTIPSCDYGAYDKSSGRCPVRKFRRMRYPHRARGR